MSPHRRQSGGHPTQRTPHPQRERDGPHIPNVDDPPNMEPNTVKTANRWTNMLRMDNHRILSEIPHVHIHHPNATALAKEMGYQLSDAVRTAIEKKKDDDAMKADACPECDEPMNDEPHDCHCTDEPVCASCFSCSCDDGHVEYDYQDEDWYWGE